MELRTEPPTRRVLRGDDGAPLDDDRVLALALRWAERPLTVAHVKPGERSSPVDGVEIRWEGTLPIIATAGGTRAWVERGSGQWVDPGRRTALELGEVLVVQSGELTLEARLQRRSEKIAVSPRQENLFFGLVMAHTLMLFIALATALVITPRTEEDSMWGAPSVLRFVATPWMPPPERKKVALEERVNEAVAKATVRDFAPVPKKATAMDTLQRLLGGGGGGIFQKGLGGGIDAALDALGNTGGHQVAADGFGGMGGRNLGGGIDGNGLSLGRIGPGRGPGNGPGGGLRGHQLEDIICRSCTPNLTPGYDRDLVLKVVRRHQNEIRFCYESELAKTPSLAGKVTVAWTIAASGAVETAQIAESGLSNATVEACIVQRVRRWSFPEPSSGQEVAITFPWVFQVAGGPDE